MCGEFSGAIDLNEPGLSAFPRSLCLVSATLTPSARTPSTSTTSSLCSCRNGDEFRCTQHIIYNNNEPFPATFFFPGLMSCMHCGHASCGKAECLTVGNARLSVCWIPEFGCCYETLCSKCNPSPFGKCGAMLMELF